MARLSKKAYNNGNGFGDHQAVYDDVFRGPPKFGLPTLSPRVEDYAEIFGGFHASRASSIPILDLPALDHEANFSFEESSHFDYSQVFGASNACDFAVTFEQLFNQSNKNSCDEAWYAIFFFSSFPPPYAFIWSFMPCLELEESGGKDNGTVRITKISYSLSSFSPNLTME